MSNSEIGRKEFLKFNFTISLRNPFPKKHTTPKEKSSLFRTEKKIHLFYFLKLFLVFPYRIFRNEKNKKGIKNKFSFEKCFLLVFVEIFPLYCVERENAREKPKRSDMPSERLYKTKVAKFIVSNAWEK